MKKLMALVAGLALCISAASASVKDAVSAPIEAQAAANSDYNYGEAEPVRTCKPYLVAVHIIKAAALSVKPVVVVGIDSG